jgi:ribonucleoside-diphosphate reductase beta chain
MSIFKPTTNSHLKQPMFFGESVAVARYDTMRMPWIDALTDRQHGFFWRPTEIDLNRDAIDFRERLTDNERFIFTENLKYQILLDSVQGRAPTQAFLPICSLPELETFIEAWAFFETIHSRSYTHILQNVFPNPSSTLDDITVSPAILERAKAVTAAYDMLIMLNAQHATGVSDRYSYNHKRQLYLTFIAVYMLEAVRFYVSFACSFSFNERALMEGNAKIIKLIARDEALHMSFTQRIVNTWQNGEEGDEWKEVVDNCKPHALAMIKVVISQEKAWAEHLFQNGSMLGLNAAILHQYIDYIADVRIKQIGFEPLSDVKRDPLPWMRAYLTSDAVQPAPQETEISSYVSGGVDMKLDLSSLKF